MKIHRFQQYTPEWWESHRGRPSASNFSKIITPAKCDYSKSAVDYMCELIAEEYDPEYGMVESYVSAAMKNGLIMEPEARSFYEMERDCDVEQVGLCESDCGRFICSPDALCGEDGVLELKSPGYKTHVKYLLAGELPPEYKPQCHGHLLVTKRQWCDFCSYVRGLPPLLVRVTPDDYTLKLAKALETFWKEFVTMRDKITTGREQIIAEAIRTAEAAPVPY